MASWSGEQWLSGAPVDYLPAPDMVDRGTACVAILVALATGAVLGAVTVTVLLLFAGVLG